MRKITVLLACIFMLMPLFLLAQSKAYYDITFESVWDSVENDPTNGISTIDLPTNAHWSPLAVVTHKTANSFLMMGNQASAGIESIAETGATSTFENEVNTNADANQIIIGSGLNASTGTITISNLEVNEDFPLVTLASMIAPSPDWFIAVNGENLRSGNSNINNGWKATFAIDLYPYDAGTEDGNMYSLSNPDSNPIGIITNISNISPFNDKKIGTVTFTYKSSTLSINERNSIKNLMVYPNPAKDYITISNIENTALNAIEIYNVLGHLVMEKNFKTNTSKITLDVKHFNKGIYLINFTDKNGKTASKKIIIE